MGIVLILTVPLIKLRKEKAAQRNYSNKALLHLADLIVKGCESLPKNTSASDVNGRDFYSPANRLIEFQIIEQYKNCMNIRLLY